MGGEMVMSSFHTPAWESQPDFNFVLMACVHRIASRAILDPALTRELAALGVKAMRNFKALGGELEVLLISEQFRVSSTREMVSAEIEHDKLTSTTEKALKKLSQAKRPHCNPNLGPARAAPPELPVL